MTDYKPMDGASGGLQRAPSRRDQFKNARDVPVDQRPSFEELSDHVLRAGFIKKVYGILFMQMCMTCGICVVMMLCEPVRVFCMANMMSHAFRIALFIPTICSLCCLQVSKNNYPLNYYLLFFFTFCMSLSVGGICAAYYEAGMGALIAEAFAITAVIFFGLSAYVLISGQNFSWMGSFLFAALCALCFVGFLGIFFPALRNNIMFPLIGALVFSGYIVYDTWRISKHFGYDDYIIASIELYLDIVNLFLYILEILSSNRK